MPDHDDERERVGPTVESLLAENERLWRALYLACGDAWPDAASTSQRYYEIAEHTVVHFGSSGSAAALNKEGEADG